MMDSLVCQASLYIKICLCNCSLKSRQQTETHTERDTHTNTAVTTVPVLKGKGSIITYLALSNVCAKRSFCKIFGDEKTPWKCDNTELQTCRNVSNCIFFPPSSLLFLLTTCAKSHLFCSHHQMQIRQSSSIFLLISIKIVAKCAGMEK